MDGDQCRSDAFARQSAASGNAGRVAGKARTSAAGLYVGMCGFGGCVGFIVSGDLPKGTGWVGCVGIIVVIQAFMALIAGKIWRDNKKPRLLLEFLRTPARVFAEKRLFVCLAGGHDKQDEIHAHDSSLHRAAVLKH